MDDFPAGPACSEPGRPRLSVVIPVHNGGLGFERCLRRLRDSDRTDFELVVVDDASTDDSPRIAERFGARLIRQPRKTGPAHARNAGAVAATGELIFFLDADVAVHRDTIRRALDRFDKDPTLDALFGSYDAQPDAPGIVSRFRNLLHHWVHQRGDFVADARPVKTFWTGCGVIRRELFLELGGFDPKLYARPAIEDIELGYRIHRSGRRVVLARDVQATHLKRWTLISMIRTDVFQRGVPWMLLLWRMKIDESDLNVSHGQRLCVVATAAALASAPFVAVVPALGFVPAAALATIMLVNHAFYRFLIKQKGVVFAFASVPVHFVYYCCCGASVAIALGVRAAESGRERRIEAAGTRVDSAEVALSGRSQRRGESIAQSLGTFAETGGRDDDSRD